MEVPLPKVTHLVGLEQGFECKQLPYAGLFLSILYSLLHTLVSPPSGLRVVGRAGLPDQVAGGLPGVVGWAGGSPPKVIAEGDHSRRYTYFLMFLLKGGALSGAPVSCFPSF